MTTKVQSNADGSSSILNGAVEAIHIATDGKVSFPATNFSVPSGAVMDFAMNAAPAGWLSCNGALVSRTTYAALFAAIGTTWGAGDGSTTFQLPDMRGYFRRGAGTNVDGVVSGAFAVKQASGNLSHAHLAQPVGDHSHGVFPNISSSAVSGGGLGAIDSGGGRTDATNGAGAHSHIINPDGLTESRPNNIAVLTCIKT